MERDFPPELIRKQNIKVILLVGIWDGDSFENGVDTTPPSSILDWKKFLALLENAEDTLSPDETFLAELSPSIGTHVGPGTLAIAFMHGD
jgi:fatty acid-binding protein DegV